MQLAAACRRFAVRRRPQGRSGELGWVLVRHDRRLLGYEEPSLFSVSPISPGRCVK